MSHGPMKTAPKVARDFKLFDPLKSSVQANILAHQGILSHGNAVVTLPAGACQHEYTTKRDQSHLPPEDLRSRDQERFWVAVVCRNCRLHARVQIELATAVDACPNSDNPLHCFDRLSAIDVSRGDLLRYGWKCSAPACGAELTIDYHTSILTDDDIKLLTRPDLLRKRFEDVVLQDPSREGLKEATSMDALWRLRRYIADSMKPDHTRRTFPANNKRFMEAFGVYGGDCQDILVKIGFRYSVINDERSWTLPNPGEDSTMLTRLDDLDFELRACMYKEQLASRAINPATEMGWNSADRDIDRILGAQGYHRSVAFPLPSNEDQAPYAAIGALPDFSDSIIGFCFDRQISSDPSNTPSYYESLREIVDLRQSEDLQLKAVQLESVGMMTRSEIQDAFRELSVSESDDDERILGLFHAALPDLPSDRQNVYRQALLKIGKLRNSQQLLHAANQTFETSDEALGWIGNGVNKDTADDFVINLCQMKMNDSPENHELGRKALSLIARERKSNVMNNWLTTGTLSDYQIGLDEACNYLDIGVDIVNNNKVDLVEAAFVVARSDKPGDYTERIIKTVQTAMNGAGATFSQAPSQGSSDWPVGLISHGNTCYLNSILQYYFSIKPLRDIILNFDKYKYDTSQGEKSGIRVGQREISMAEVNGGMKFVGTLRQLFEQMITSPGAQVKPDEELVCRTFLAPTDHALIQAEETKRRMTEVDDRPMGQNMNGSVPEDAIMNDEQEQPLDTPETSNRLHSNASSTTLVSVDNGPSGTVRKEDASPPIQTFPDLNQGESAKPPALPPRPSRVRQQSLIASDALKTAQDNARNQQDVAEVHDNCMFRMRAGMRPIGKEQGNEQKDDLRQLFAFATEESTLNDSLSSKPTTQVMEYIQLAIAAENTDIYAAMEQLFDSSDESGVQKHVNLLDFPKLLQVNIPRNSYEVKDGIFRPVKVMHDIRLEDELYLDRFTDASHLDTRARRRQCWEWRQQLQQMKKERKLLTTSPEQLEVDAAMAAHEGANFVKNMHGAALALDELGLSMGAEVALARHLQLDSQGVSESLTRLNRGIEDLQSRLVTAYDTISQQYKYRLHTVFFHRGGAGSGHYWVYIHDFEKDIWRKYNDETVTPETDLDKIVKANGATQGTPTYAVYVRDDAKASVVQPLFRQIEEQKWADAEWHNEWPSGGDTHMDGGDMHMNRDEMGDAFDISRPDTATLPGQPLEDDRW